MTTLFLALTAASAQSQATRINEGETFVAPVTGVFVTSTSFINLTNAQELMKFHKDRADALVVIVREYDVLLESKRKRIVWLGEEYEALLQLHKDRPTDSFVTKLGQVGLAVTGGFALCEAIQ